MKKLLFTIVVSFIFTQNYGQINEEKQYFDTHKDLGGDVSIKKSYVKIDGEYAYRVFEIEVPEEGEYYLNLWMMVPQTKEGYKNYTIKVNDEMQAKSINPEKDGWQNIKLRDKVKTPEQVKLIKGLNTIAIGSTLPDIPEIEFVKLSKDINKSEISSDKYDAFVTKIKEDMVARSKNNAAKRDSTTSRLKSYTLDTEGGNYYNVMDVNYSYTYNTSFYFTSGTTVTFAAAVALSFPGYDPVIELFNESNPEGGGSWVA